MILLVAVLIALAVCLIAFGFFKLRRPPVIVQPPRPDPAVVTPQPPPPPETNQIPTLPPVVTNVPPPEPVKSEPPVVTNVPPPEPVKPEPPPSAVSTQAEESVKPPPIVWPGIKVNGIVGRGRTGSAILNNKVVPIGESTEGVTVVEIGKQPSVTLEFKGERKTLRINDSTL
jgi:hypothetical protein